MYTGSADFQTVNARPIQKQRITGTVDGVAFTSRDILNGSLSISNQCSDSSDYKLGGVFVGQMAVTFLKSFAVTAETWQGKEIVVNFGLCIDEDNDIWEDFSLGHFTVYEANSVADGIAIKAYDAMANFDKVATWQPVGTLYQVLQKLCQRCNVTLGMTQLEVEALINGTQNYGLWPENDCTTYRDLLYWCAVTVGGFATINRDGELILKSYKRIMDQVATTPVLAWDKRCTGAKVSDYKTYYRGLYLTDAKTDEAKYYGNASGGPAYDMGKNPFIQYGTQTTKDQMANNVLQSLQVRLRPFTATIMSAPIWELGDIISMTGGLATGYESRTVVHSWNYSTSKGTTIACYGSNPALANVSKDKSASAASKSAAMNGISYKRYSNPNEIVVGGSEAKVCDIYFTAEKVTDVEMWHEFLIDTALTDSSMTLEAIYYLDGVELSRRPVETYSDTAEHILTLNYCLGVDEGNHRWEVYLLATGGTATLDAEDGISVLKGQGLAKGDVWDGVIILADEVSFVYATTTLLGVTTSVNVNNVTNDTEGLSDNVSYQDQENVLIVISENLVVTLITGDHINRMGENYMMGTEGVLL
jgi:hypothetical protein